MNATSQVAGVEATLRTFRGSRIGKSLTPLEAEFSLPVPFTKNGRQFVSVLMYGTSRDPAGNGLVLHAPHAAITVSHPDGQLSRFEDYRNLKPLGDETPAPDTPIGLFPHPTVSTLKPKEYAARRRRLLELTETILEGGAVPDDYPRLWALLMEPAFAPYYWVLAPRFLRDIMGGSKQSNG